MSVYGNPPRTPALGPICSCCYPETGDRNTMCERHLTRSLALEFAAGVSGGASVTFEHVPTVETVAMQVIPGLEPVTGIYRDMKDEHQLPILRGVDIRRQSVLLSGPGGRGKTYQAALLTRLAIRRSGEHGIPQASRFQWHNEVDLLEHLRRLQRVEGAASALLDSLIHADVLVIDDYGAEKPSEWVSSRMYGVLNARYEAGRATVVTTNLSPAQMESRSARFAGRILEMAGDYALFFRDEDTNYRKLRSATAAA